SDHLLARADVRLDVDGVELDPPRREQLLRLGAGGSAGAGVEARLHRVHYTRCAMAPQRPLYHRFAWAFDLVVPDASAARVRRLAARARDAVCATLARALAPGGVLLLDVRDWRRTAARKRLEPVTERTVRTPRGRLSFRSDTRLDPARRRLLLREEIRLTSRRR